MNKYKILIVLFFLSCFIKTANAEDFLNSVLQPEQVSEDLDQWLQFLDKTHPQLSYRIENVKAFLADVEKLKVSTTKPISVLEFWRKVSAFNSVLNDGHTVINLPKLKTLANQHITNGGRLFPFEVIFDENRLLIKSEANGKPTHYIGSEITQINGQKINEFIEPLLQRTNGDTVRFRRALLQRRFAELVWLYYGNFDSFTLQLNKGGDLQTKKVVSSRNKLNVEKNFSEQFKFELVDKHNALLTINTFSWGAKYQDVIDFLHDSFGLMIKNNIQHLIIDIRENGGGDDAIWIDGVLPYIADKTWRTGSKFKVKVLEGRADEGEKVGDVVNGQNRFREVEPGVNKFNGEVSVLISAFTYSSSILFSNVVQDYQFGQLVGEKTGGNSDQTGGTKAITLKHSKLRAISPFFYLERPKGGGNKLPVEPDIVIDYDKAKPIQLVNKLIRHRNLNIDSTK